ncbi:MAG: Npt1/Npt2 family nucleotide transporter [Rickettsiales bacterium]
MVELLANEKQSHNFKQNNNVDKKKSTKLEENKKGIINSAKNNKETINLEESNNLNSFSKLRSILFPIYNYEFKLFFTISLFLFAILFNQNILRILKNSIIISEISVEVTSFIKVYFVTPVAALLVILYANLVNRMSLFKIFYILISIFTAFYLIFGFILYPNLEIFHLSQDNTKILMQEYIYIKWFIAMLANWSYIIFYTASEMWPNMFYILIFWQICNHISTVDQASRFYRILVLLGNSAVIIAGFVMQKLSSSTSFIFEALMIQNNNQNLIKISSLIILINSIIACFCVYYIAKKSKTDKFNIKLAPKLGIKESLQYITKSKYLWMMLICSAAFGLTMNLIEGLWYSQIKEAYPDLNGYTEYSSIYVMWTGLTIMFFTIFSGILMKFFGWFITTLMTPIIILITGVIFFMFTIFGNQINSVLGFTGEILSFTILIGSIQNIISKGVKYSIWDSFREMLYLPLDKELKTKGKAAVDLLSSKIGKSLSSILQSILFTLMPDATYNSLASFMIVFFIISCFAWIVALFNIRTEYNALIQK